jgi:hypothetical protein
MLMGILLLSAVVFLLYSMRDAGRNTDEGAPAPSSADDAAQSGHAQLALLPAAPPDVSLERYEDLGQRSIFASRRARSAPKDAPKPQPVPPPPPFPEPNNAARRKKPVDLAGWAYAGHVLLDDDKIGIVQHESSTTVEWLRVGDELLGAKVTEIDGKLIRFGSGSGKNELSRERDFPVTPLDKAASRKPARTPRRR